MANSIDKISELIGIAIEVHLNNFYDGNNDSKSYGKITSLNTRYDAARGVRRAFWRWRLKRALIAYIKEWQQVV